MEANTSYKMSMKVKASADTVVPVVLQEKYVIGNIDIEDTNGEWVTKEIEFTTQEAINKFELRIVSASEKFYIDDIKIVDSATGETTIYNQDFEAFTQTYAVPGNIAVLPGDSSAVFTWDNSTVGANTEFITIYEKMSDGTLAMKARVWKGLTGITLNNLENGKIYNFVVTAETTCGLETDRNATPYTVTPEKAATVKYEYEPGNVMVTGYNPNATNKVVSARLSWKNPLSENLNAISVYKIAADGTESLLTNNVDKTPGATAYVTDSSFASGTATYGSASYRIVFGFSDGETREVIYTGKWSGDTGAALSEVGFSRYLITNAANQQLPEIMTSYSNTERYGTTGNSFVLESNRYIDSAVTYSKYELNAGNILTAGQSYKLSMMVKAPESATLKNNSGGGTINIPATGSGWAEVTQTFTATSAAFVISGETPHREIYIDDLKIVKTSDNSVAYSFASKTIDALELKSVLPTNISAVAGDTTATFSWTRPTNGYYINVYEKDADGNLMLRAKVAASAEGVKLSNLKNDTAHTFVVKTQDANGLETAASDEINVTPEKAATVKYEYEPGNVMVTGYNPNATNKVVSARLSWKNPLSENLNAISVYKIASDGSESLLTNNVDKTPGATAYVTDNSFASGTTSYGSASYRIVFGFSDGETREVIYTGKWSGDTGAALSEVGFSRYLITNAANQQLPEIMTSYSNTERYGTTGNSFVLESNRYIDSAVAYSKYELHTGSVLTTGQTYKLSMMVKAPESATLTNKSGGVAINIPATGSGWAEVSQTFTATSAAFVISGETPHREIYIDDLKIVKTSDNSVAYSFASKTIDALELKSVLPTDISAVAGNATATFSWTKPASGYYINVYEKDIYGNLMLRAKVAASAEGVKLSNLKNDTAHTFVIKTQDANGLETSASDEINVTPIAPDYEISKPMLLSGATEATTLTDGTYSAKATVKNNKITSGMSAQLIVAVYNGKVLEKCYVSTKATVSAGNSHPVTIDEIVISDTVNKDCSVKVMLWKGLGELAPWCESTPYSE